MNIDSLKEVFRKHVEKYDMTDSAIIRKFYHSYRVMDLCLLIARDNNFSEEDIEIAMLVGLLHDYSRFEQWTKFGTYNDLKSVDHGDLAVLRLFNDNEIVDYCDNKDYYDVVSDAIEYHNKYDFPGSLSDRSKLFCNLVRDADKLDIFYLFGINQFFVKEDDLEISEKIKNDFFSNKLLNRKDVNNASDNLLLMLGMVFNLNFDYSFKYLYDMKLIDKIFVNIKNKDKYRVYFDYVNKYILDKINNN